MIIDFHTHTYPDKIAAKTVELLAGRSGTVPHSDGTLMGLESDMEWIYPWCFLLPLRRNSISI